MAERNLGELGPRSRDAHVHARKVREERAQLGLGVVTRNGCAGTVSAVLVGDGTNEFLDVESSPDESTAEHAFSEDVLIAVSRAATTINHDEHASAGLQHAMHFRVAACI